MSRQDKATTERFTRTLRELVKRPENKVCADCKRNDPRWASWNIGVFLCIRCSGIHRSMGTHISRVKSVDLDLWTPEQMESIQKWGNGRANIYWEAHLKKGHVPPEHKMDSFIRSKYESKRWAMEGPRPSDPSVLEGGAAAPSADLVSPAPVPAVPTNSLSSPARKSAPIQPQPRHVLLSTSSSFKTSSPVSATAAQHTLASTPTPKPSDDLFSLDFNSPVPTSSLPQSQEQKKDVKQDILSLFSAPAQPAAPAYGASAWGQPTAQQQPQQQPQQSTSMMGSTGAGMWGASSGWAPSAAPAPANDLWGGGAPAVAASPNNSLFGGLPQSSPAQQPSLFSSGADIWGSSSSSSAAENDPFGSFTSGTTTSAAAKSAKDDVFGDIWGGFK